MAQTVERPGVETAPSRLSAIADPGPLGLAGFAATTFFLSTVNAGLLSGSVESVVLGIALFYGGVAQLLAGMWEFAKGNTFGAVAFTSYGAFWMAFWYLLNHLPADASAADTSHAVATFLLVFTVFTAYMTIAASRTSGAVFLVFIVLTVTFVFLTIGNYAQSENIVKIGGWLGLITAALAWYGSMAGVTNATFGRTVFPIMPRS